MSLVLFSFGRNDEKTEEEYNAHDHCCACPQLKKPRLRHWRTFVGTVRVNNVGGETCYPCEGEPERRQTRCLKSLRF